MLQLLMSACADCFLPFGVAEKKYDRCGRRITKPHEGRPILHQYCIKTYNAKHPLKECKKKKARKSYAIKRIVGLTAIH